MKKITYALILALVFACLLISSVSAATKLASGTAGDITWEIYSDGEMIINGDGDMPDYASASKTPWYSQRTKVTDITIEKGVESIGDYAFSSFTNLVDVDLPNTVKSIGTQAFSGCSDLEEIDLPNSIKSLGNRVFFNCTSLEEVKMPADMTSINTSMFYGCTSLEVIELPEELVTIRQGAFYNCKSLYDIVLPYTLEEIGEEAFYGCTNLEEVYFLGDAPTLVENEGQVFDDNDDLYIYYMDGATGFTKTQWTRKYNVEEYKGRDYEYGGVDEDDEDEDDGWITNGNSSNKNNNKNLDCGDLDDNGRINSKDLTILRNVLSNQEGFDADDYGYAPDVDDDGDITVIDYVILARYIDGWDDYDELPW